MKINYDTIPPTIRVYKCVSVYASDKGHTGDWIPESDNGMFKTATSRAILYSQGAYEFYSAHARGKYRVKYRSGIRSHAPDGTRIWVSLNIEDASESDFVFEGQAPVDNSVRVIDRSNLTGYRPRWDCYWSRHGITKCLTLNNWRDTMTKDPVHLWVPWFLPEKLYIRTYP